MIDDNIDMFMRETNRPPIDHVSPLLVLFKAKLNFNTDEEYLIQEVYQANMFRLSY